MAGRVISYLPRVISHGCHEVRRSEVAKFLEGGRGNETLGPFEGAIVIRNGKNEGTRIHDGGVVHVGVERRVGGSSGEGHREGIRDVRIVRHGKSWRNPRFAVGRRREVRWFRHRELDREHRRLWVHDVWEWRGHEPWLAPRFRSRGVRVRVEVAPRRRNKFASLEKRGRLIQVQGRHERGNVPFRAYVGGTFAREMAFPVGEGGRGLIPTQSENFGVRFVVASSGGGVLASPGKVDGSRIGSRVDALGEGEEERSKIGGRSFNRKTNRCRRQRQAKPATLEDVLQASNGPSCDVSQSSLCLPNH